jgi:hypothetical protein
MTGSVDEQIAALSRGLMALSAEVDSLKRENAELRDALQASAAPAELGESGRAPAASPAPRDEVRAVDRRALFRLGGLAAAGAAVATVASASPAAAGTDGDVVINAENIQVASARTSIRQDSPAGEVFGVFNGASSGTGLRGRADVDSGTAYADVWRYATVGVFGETGRNGGYGVVGIANNGTGLFGNGLVAGVYGVSSTGNGVRGDGNVGVSGGGSTGVRGQAAAIGVEGVVLDAGPTVGVKGTVGSTSGKAVYGNASATSGTTYGVYGQAASASGFALYGQGRLKVTGRSYLATPNSAPTDAHLSNGSISFFLDQTNNRLKVRVKYSSGALKTGFISLT